MRTVCISLLLASAGFSAAAQPMPTPALECPQCGSWQINWANPSGVVGERITVGTDSVEFPACGRFHVNSLQTSASISPVGYRSYRVMVLLQPFLAEGKCSTPPDSMLSMEVEIGVGYNRDGGRAQFSIYKSNVATPVVTAEAWNFERDNPCDSGSGSGSVACLQIANARTYKLFATEVYRAHTELAPRESAALSRRLNPATFAATTLAFCIKREEERGFGSWPYAWALTCQSERLQQKMTELRTWRACLESKSAGCSVPTSIFDQSPRAID